MNFNFSLYFTVFLCVFLSEKEDSFSIEYDDA